MPKERLRASLLTVRLTSEEYDALYRRSVQERTAVSKLAHEMILRSLKNTVQTLSA
jgi:hypothetical protein